MAVEFPQNEEIFGRGKNGERKGVGPAIRRRRIGEASIFIRERKQ